MAETVQLASLQLHRLHQEVVQTARAVIKVSIITYNNYIE